MRSSLFASSVLMITVLGCSSATSDKNGTTPAPSAPNAPTTVSTVAIVSKKLQQ